MKGKKVSLLGLCAALALALAFLESLLPPLAPGIKLGLANSVALFVLYWAGTKEAAAVSLVRVALANLLFGSVTGFVYSLAGGALSLLAMCLLKKTKRFSCVPVSVVGGVCHNIGQIAAACFFTGTRQIVWYLPVLLISGIAAGVAVGLLTGTVLKRMNREKYVQDINSKKS